VQNFPLIIAKNISKIIYDALLQTKQSVRVLKQYNFYASIKEVINQKSKKNVVQIKIVLSDGSVVYERASLLSIVL
jgi:uncharacterized membrane protein YheB (UPF0754 family)